MRIAAATPVPILPIRPPLRLDPSPGTLSHRADEVNPIADAHIGVYSVHMHHDDTRRRAAVRDLEKLRQEGDALGGFFTRLWPRPAPDAGDPIELWGTRIGRALSVAALIGLCLYLYWTLRP